MGHRFPLTALRNGTPPGQIRMLLRLRCRACLPAWLLAICGTLLCQSFVAAQSTTAYAIQESSPKQSIYDAELTLFEGRFNVAPPSEQAVLLHRAYELRDYVDDRGRLERWIACAAADQALHALVRDEALHLLARIDLHHDLIEDADRKISALGFVRQWAIVGPFAGQLSQTSPEAGFNPEPGYRDAAGHVRKWRTLPEIGPHAWINLADFYSPPGAATAFAATSIYSGWKRVLALRASAESAVTVWVNGRRVFVGPDSQQLGFDQHAIAIELHAGWNQILLKLSRGDTARSWRFALRLTELQGQGVALRCSAQQFGIPTGETGFPSTLASSPRTPEDLVSMAARAAEAQPRSAAALELLARMEQAHETGSALPHMEAAARLEPTAERWHAVAEMQSDSTRFSALTAALVANPQFAPAKIALSAYYSQRGQLEKARDLLQQAVASSPRDFVAQKRLADVYAAAGLNSRAAENLAKIEKMFPQPLWVKRAIAARYQELGWLQQAEVLLKLALKESADAPTEMALAERIAERQGDINKLREIYQHRRRLYPTDTHVLDKLAALEAGTGNLAAATNVLRAALNIDPESDDLHQRMADVLAGQGDIRGSRQELARALECNPQLENVRWRLELYSAAERDPDPDTGYLVRAADLAQQARENPPQDDAAAVALADVRIDRVYENGLSSVRLQQVTYVLNSEGARLHSTDSIQYAPGIQQLHVLHARVYKADGRVVQGALAGEKAASETGAAMYYDVRSRSVRFPDVEKGDVIELDYRIIPTSKLNPYGSYFGELVAFQSSSPTRLKRFVLVTPADREFGIHEERMQSAATVKLKGSERTYCWEARDVPSLSAEPRGPAITELAPYVHVSTFHSWDELGRWYAQLVQPQFELDADLRETLASVISGARSEEQRIRAIHQFVLRNTHYVALEFGVYSYKPYPVSQTYARHFGDCKDKASLLVALLRAAGIDADLALVRTRHLGDISDRPASISIFNHAVAYIPRYDLWLDGTAEYSGLHELPIENQGAMALTVACNGQTQLRRIPVTTSAENYTRRTVNAQIGDDGVIRFTGSAYTRGEDTPGLRREYEIAERQRDSFRNRLAEVFPTVRLEDVKVEGANDLDRDVSVDFRGELATFAGRKSITLISSWMPRHYVESLAPLSARREDVVLPAPWTTEEHLYFMLPADGAIAVLPSNFRLNTPFGGASLSYEQRGREVIIHTSVEFRQTRITPGQYPAFRDFCASVERSFRNEVKVVLER